MTVAIFSADSNYRLEVDSEVVSQNISNNTSTVHWWVKVIKTAGAGYASSTGNSGSADSNAAGVNDLWSSSSIQYNFQNGSETGTWTFAEGNIDVSHDLDGSGSYFINGTMTLTNLGTATAGTGTISLPSLPRIQIKIDGIWRFAIPHVKVDGIWKPAQPYVKVDGIWKKSG